MEPTLPVGEQLIVNKFAYLFGSPERDDFVVCESPVSDEMLIKRVVGLPGETVSITEKQVFIDDEQLDEPYAYYSSPGILYVGDDISSYLVPEDHYFLMGDNRDHSRDSRDWSEDEGLQTQAIYIKRIHGKILGSNKP